MRRMLDETDINNKIDEAKLKNIKDETSGVKVTGPIVSSTGNSSIGGKLSVIGGATVYNGITIGSGSLKIGNTTITEAQLAELLDLIA